MKNTKNSFYISNSSYKTQISSNENCSISFHGKNDNELGKLEFNDKEMTFSGNTDESAKIFFDTLIKTSTVYNKEIEKRIMTLNEKIENKVRGYASYSSIIQHIKDELKDIIK